MFELSRQSVSLAVHLEHSYQKGFQANECSDAPTNHTFRVEQHQTTVPEFISILLAFVMVFFNRDKAEPSQNLDCKIR